ncbi:conserved hypothetical protein [Ancylobacter novellus DSM 506]|uniref:Amidohydrolase n=2 Tax=Ancylobacter novellus TaxID=921 RepID=D7AAQ0_ANCN5|nr:conserved hypothetical protein [Ancylobacter novellus DSM 506]
MTVRPSQLLSVSGSADADDLPIIDAHHHYWDLSLGKHPWLNNAPYPGNRYGDYRGFCVDFMPDDYRRASGRHRIVGNVYMEAEWGDIFGIWILLALGTTAYFMEENGFPIAPMVLGIVLGEIVEQNFMQALISSNGNVLGLFSRPIAAVLGVVTIIVWTVPLMRLAWSRRGRTAPASVTDDGNRGPA